MSYASLIADVIDEPDKEIVERRVLIRAYAEATSGDIIMHVHPEINIGPSTCNGFNVRVAIYDEPSGGHWTANFFCAPHIVVGEFVKLGGPKVNP